ncbi:MAG TPA: filamentous hemagglutinin N-terminal domain-containing protein [Paraburkholderia sp.]|jgi:filamentous hemagglutinin family protein
MQSGLFSFCVATLACLPLVAHAAGVVADGGTVTTVSTGASGRQTVNIAPATGGVSHNTYTSFNVGAAGVDLNNTGINARTIVNEVTSTNPSVIAGQLQVLGPRANVVLANPNGITVNGGSFVNTGRVALSTGQVSFQDIPNGVGGIQRNVVLDTQTGTIVVGPQGLSSALIALDLIAKNVLINGPLTNTFSNGNANLRAVGGTSLVTLDTGLSPQDNANDWLSIQPRAAQTASSFAVDITAAGSLTSGRIQLIVTDKGPGVRVAGPLNATLGNFTLSSNGAVQIANTAVTAAGDIDMQIQDALSVTDAQLKTSNGAATIAASGAVGFTGSMLLANGGVSVSGGGVTLQPDASGQSVVASATSGVVLNSTADITNLGSLVQGEAQNTSDPQSLGAVTLNAAGNVINQSTTGTPLAILFGVSGDVVVQAGGSVINEDARILSNDNVTIAAAGDVDNIVDHSDGVNGGVPVSYSASGRRYLIFNHRDSGYTVDYGELADPDKLAYITSEDTGNVTITARNVSNIGGSILANGGSISISAQQNLLTQGVFTGTASFHESCFIFCSSNASANVQSFGGVIEASNDIRLQAGTQITNTGGTVLAVGSLTLDAPKTLAQGVLGYTAINRTHDLKAWFGNTWSAIYANDTGGVFAGGSGQVQLTGEADIDGGTFSAPLGIAAARGIQTLRVPYHQPVTIGNRNHLGLVSWFGL